MTADQGAMVALARLLIAADAAVTAWSRYDTLIPELDPALAALAVAVRETSTPQRYRTILEALAEGDGARAVALWHGESAVPCVEVD